MIEIYTDGAAKGNPGRGGYAAILTCDGKEKVLSGAYDRTTNNRMELLAVIKGLEEVKGEGKRIIVYADSLYVVHSIEKGWLLNWEKKNFKKRKNVDLWKRFLRVYRRHNVTCRWVQGHAGHPMNERCDQLAEKAAYEGPWLKDEVYEANEVRMLKVF